ncbi:Hypothetical predicted protein [Podarcis lilfordi]|uniref:Uncharacterized protein n=1 Tax=Podarcis lilfordi TaxID=74358 RepID=A0AA35K6I9_9SAUR|nr:Hypothetical predicted protein [Podarcis lilfordi]
MWCRFTPRKVSCQPGADIACLIKELVAVLGAYMGPFCHSRVGLKAGCDIVLAERGMVPYFVCCSADAVNHRGAKSLPFLRADVWLISASPVSLTKSGHSCSLAAFDHDTLTSMLDSALYVSQVREEFKVTVPSVQEFRSVRWNNSLFSPPPPRHSAPDHLLEVH